jgi:RimJ/RimL family protein N-acetyltransferase
MRLLNGSGVTLEPQVAGHAAELYAVLRDPGLYEFTDAGVPESEDSLRQRLARLESRVSPDGAFQWLNWVVRNEAGAVVGYVQATLDRNSEAEVAYVIGRAFWRRGYATEACRVMLAELAATFGARRALARIDDENEASLSLVRKLGFEPAGAGAEPGELLFGRDL